MFQTPFKHFRPLLLLFAFFTSCAKEPEEDPKKGAEKPKPELVGRIASIPAGREFVLIQAYGKWIVETGSILTTVGPDGRAANLLVTGEKLGQFAAADIQSGILEVGDGVYKLPKAPEKTEATDPGTEEATPVGTGEATPDGTEEATPVDAIN